LQTLKKHSADLRGSGQCPEYPPANARLLVFHQGALGDLVVAFRAIRNLRKRFSVIHGICQSSIGALACRLGIFDRFFSIESALFSTLFSDQPDAVIQSFLEAYTVSIWFSYSKDLETVVRKTAPGRAVLIAPRPDPFERIHVACHIERSLMEAGLSDGELLQEFDENGQYIGKPVIRKKRSGPLRALLHIGSGSPRKNWPLASFQSVYRRLSDMGMHPAFLLGPAEHHTADELKNFECRLPRDLTALYDLFRQADGYIGSDSGVTHLSAYLQIPTVAVFGPSDPLRWHPMGSSVQVVASEACTYSPCFETEKRYCRDCLKQIPPEMVITGFLNLFDNHSGVL
jgi:heptosyltransferase III